MSAVYSSAICFRNILSHFNHLVKMVSKTKPVLESLILLIHIRPHLSTMFQNILFYREAFGTISY